MTRIVETAPFAHATPALFGGPGTSTLRFFFRFLAVLSLLSLLVGLSTSRAAAQAGVTWNEPFNLSDSPTGSVHPAIVCDAYGYVHVFWSEDMNGRYLQPDELSDGGNTIMYRRWDGKTWTEPLDILAVAGDPLADFVAVTVDSTNRLHLVWTGLTNLYYSNAPASEAYSVKAWATSRVIDLDSARSEYESDVAVDAQGRVHIVYATRGTPTGVFHIMSSPYSQTWGAPIIISDYLRENEVALKDVRVAVDESERVHAAWSTVNTNGYSQAVYYVRSEPSGEAWDTPTMLADATTNTGFTGFPSLLAHGRDELVLIHVDQGNQGRIERTSFDGGKTWNEPRFILSGMEGVNGFLIPLIDGAGNLHLMINMRPSADQRTGIYYAPRSGSDWAPVVPVAVDEPYGPSAHYLAACVRLGNEVHAVWTQLHSGEIWHVNGTIDGLAPTPVRAIPLLPQPTPTPVQVAAKPETATAEPIVTPVAMPDPLRADLATLPVQATSHWVPIAAAVIPTLLLVSSAVVWQVFRR